METDNIRVVIDDDDAPAASAKSRRPSVQELNEQSQRDRADAARHRQQAAKWRQEATHNHFQNTIATLRSASSAAQADYERAMEYGEHATAAEAQKVMTANETKIALLERDLAYLKTVPQPPADPVEAYIQGRSEPTATWLRQHPDWVIDPKKNAKLTAAHWNAVGEGLAADTTDYFDHVENFIGLRDGGPSRNGSRRVDTGYDTKNPNTHIRRGGNEVYLTKGEAEAATNGTLVWNVGPRKGEPLGTAEFARRKAQMVREGRYNKLD